MLKNREYLFLSILVFATILPKWILSIIYFDNSIIVDSIFNIKDIQYFPIVISFSDLIFNPSYLDQYGENNLLSFPTYSLLLHSIFFKIFGVYAFIILEFSLQFIFLIVLLKAVKKIFENSSDAIYFCILVFLLISLLQITLFYQDINYIRYTFDILDENFGSRLPRPLFTGIIYFYFFYVLYNFKEKLQELDLKYFILIVFLLSIFLNSFFYYFLNFLVLSIFVFYKYLNTNIFTFLKKNILKILILTLSFIFFCFPFLIQFYFGESDYSERIGVFQIDYDQRIFLLKYYLYNLFRFELLVLLILCLIIHVYLNYRSNFLKSQISKINIFFYFIFVSILTPSIFFILSPKLISIYHFLGILIFIVIFYLILTTYFILTKIISINQNLRLNNIFKTFLLIIVFILNIYIGKFILNKNYEQITEIQNIQKFLINNKLIRTNKILFSNDLKIMNLWLLNDNYQLAISDGFTNSLKNSEIEYNLMNNLKNFEILEDDFKEIISYQKPEIRNDFFMRLFSYRYQANSLYTHSNLGDYHKDLQDQIKSTSPFRVQFQVIPEKEKNRLLSYFQDFELDDKSFSEVVVIKKYGSLSNFKVFNDTYKLLFSSKNYDLYLLNESSK